MANSKVRQAVRSDGNELAKLRASLWPDLQFEVSRKEVQEIVDKGVQGTLPITIWVSQNESADLTGFIEVSLRSHADGCDPARPVGFVEGWFVQESLRGKGVGRELMRAAELWARSQGCREMASDALIDNDRSQHAHEAMGFEIVDRCVHFRKAL